LLNELRAVVESIVSLEHDEIVAAFISKGWEPYPIFSDRQYDCDAYKQRVVVEVEGVDKDRVIDYYHCKFFRFLAWRDVSKGDVGILITGVRKTSEFANGTYLAMKNDLNTFSKTLQFPIYLVGLHEDPLLNCVHEIEAS
jgi:hypothetical protein